MSTLSDDVETPYGDMCAPSDSPSSYSHPTLSPALHQAGQPGGLRPVIDEINSIHEAMRNLDVQWRGRAHDQYLATWQAAARDVLHLLGRLGTVDGQRRTRLARLHADWDRHRQIAAAAGHDPGQPPYSWMR